MRWHPFKSNLICRRTQIECGKLFASGFKYTVIRLSGVKQGAESRVIGASCCAFGTHGLCGTLRKWSRDPLAMNVVVENLLIYRAQRAARRDHVVRVFSRFVVIWNKRHIQSEVIPRYVFKSFKQAIRDRTVQIEPLVPGHFTCIPHVCKAKLGMLLIASTLLALTAGIDVVLKSSITTAMQIVPKSIVNEIVIFAEDTNGHHALDGGGVPIAVRKWCGVMKHKKKHEAEEVFRFLRVRITPSSISMSNQLVSVNQPESTERSTENRISATDLLES